VVVLSGWYIGEVVEEFWREVERRMRAFSAGDTSRRVTSGWVEKVLERDMRILDESWEVSGDISVESSEARVCRASRVVV
jgi:hypothetical protein